MTWTNDSIAGAIPLVLPAGSTGLMVWPDAPPPTLEAGETGFPSIWYTYQRSAVSTVTLDTLGSPAAEGGPAGLDTSIDVYTSPVAAPTFADLVLVASSDDHGGADPYTLNSKVVFSAAPGTKYWIRVGANAASLTLVASRVGRTSAEPVVKGLSAARSGRDSIETALRGMSAARSARHSVEVVITNAGFTEDFNRSDRELVGDNGWFASNTSPGTGVYRIVSNRLRTLVSSSGFPGSSGTVGTPVLHNVVPADPDVVDVTFDIITGGTAPADGWLYFVMGCTVSAVVPPVVNSGVLLRMLISGSNNTLIQKITATNATVDHSPAIFPTIPANSTTEIRAVLTRSTGVLQVYVNAALQYTSAAGDFSGLTGSYLGFQFSESYVNAPIEVDDVVAA